MKAYTALLHIVIIHVIYMYIVSQTLAYVLLNLASSFAATGTCPK